MRFGDFLRIVKHRSFLTAALLLPLLIFHLIALEYFSHMYWFEWMIRNRYAYIWVLIIALVWFGKTYSAVLISAGNMVGIVVGQYLGDFLRARRIAQNMDLIENPGDDRSILHNIYKHQAVEIWLYTIIAFLIVGLIARKLYKRSHPQT